MPRPLFITDMHSAIELAILPISKSKASSCRDVWLVEAQLLEEERSSIGVLAAKGVKCSSFRVWYQMGGERGYFFLTSQRGRYDGGVAKVSLEVVCVLTSPGMFSCPGK